jgi:hypothetical protein
MEFSVDCNMPTALLCTSLKIAEHKQNEADAHRKQKESHLNLDLIQLR